MARRKKKKFKLPHEKMEEHKRIAKLLFIFSLIGVFFLIIRGRQEIIWWLESVFY